MTRTMRGEARRKFADVSNHEAVPAPLRWPIRVPSQLIGPPKSAEAFLVGGSAGQVLGLVDDVLIKQPASEEKQPQSLQHPLVAEAARRAARASGWLGLHRRRHIADQSIGRIKPAEPSVVRADPGDAGMFGPLRITTNLDRGALAAYCGAYAMWADAMVAIQKYGTMIKSPSGFPQQSPYFAVANRQTEIMMRIASEFGFTPASRSRISTSTSDEPSLLE